ncbi:MAG: hypothetical protein IKD68_00555, partial [Solobacterium sp.]|nr:hypothetical protein [Solobacterium sp.]
MKPIFRKTGKTMLACLAAASLCLYDVRAEESDIKNNSSEQSEEKKNNDGKEETVYVITDASGKSSSVIVSDWLKNTSGKKTIDDASFLEDIKNVSGNESFTKNADGTITWNADGADIYYQGTTTKQLPVDMKISYTLEGKPISAEELAGKSGHVVIRFDYTNNTGEEKTVNGKSRTVRVPFAMVTGLELDEEKFSNITAVNGKVISEGERAFVVGMAFPGLKDSLAMNENNDLVSLDIPEYFEVEADTTDIELDMTRTMASGNLLGDLTVTEDGKLDELEADMNRLYDAANELTDGTGKLKEGTGKLDEGAAKLLDGTGELKNGTSA